MHLNYDTFFDRDNQDSAYLTYFRPMFHLWENQVDGFYQQNVWKTPVEGHGPASLLKMLLFHSCFSHILLVKTNYLVSA